MNSIMTFDGSLSLSQSSNYQSCSEETEQLQQVLEADPGDEALNFKDFVGARSFPQYCSQLLVTICLCATILLFVSSNVSHQEKSAPLLRSELPFDNHEEMHEVLRNKSFKTFDSFVLRGKVSYSEYHEFSSTRETYYYDLKTSSVSAKASLSLPLPHDIRVGAELLTDFKTTQYSEGYSIFTSLDQYSFHMEMDLGDEWYTFLQDCVNVKFNDGLRKLVLNEVIVSGKELSEGPTLKNIMSNFNYDEKFISQALRYIELTPSQIAKAGTAPWIIIPNNFIESNPIYCYHFLEGDHILTSDPNFNPGLHWEGCGVLFKAPSVAINNNWVPLYGYFVRSKQMHIYSTDPTQSQGGESLGIICYVRKTPDPDDKNIIPIYRTWDWKHHDNIYDTKEYQDPHALAPDGIKWYAYRAD